MRSCHVYHPRILRATVADLLQTGNAELYEPWDRARRLLSNIVPGQRVICLPADCQIEWRVVSDLQYVSDQGRG